MRSSPVLLLLVFLVSSHLFALVWSRASAPSYGSRIPVSGTEKFLVGVNYAWHSYGADFGANAWGANGVAEQESVFEAALSDMQSKDVMILRWWLFSDNRAGILFDSNHNPTGLESHVFGDMDAAISIAKANNILINFVLFDFGMMDWPSTDNGVTMGGCTDLVTDTSKLASLLNNVLIPIFQRYANEPTVFSWEIMNEPEWVISDLPQPSVDTSKVNPVTTSQFYNFASQISAAAHQYTNSYVTLGSACLKWYFIWTTKFASENNLSPLQLDFFQTHYYPWMDNQHTNGSDGLDYWHYYSPLQQNFSTLGDLDRPMIVGEFGNNNLDTGNMAQTILDNGYAGALPWSYTGGDGYSINWPSYISFERSIN